MAENRIYKGKWWLPEIPDNQVSGILTTSPELSFETIGELENPSFLEVFSSDSPLQYSVIWGIDSCAKPISIFGCAVGITQNTSCQFSLVRYDIQVVAIGAHIKSWNELGNYEVQVNIPELPFWYRPNCLNSIDHGKDIGLVTNLKDASVLSTSIGDGCTLKLEGKVNVSYSNYGLSVTINQDSILIFSFDHPISIQDAKRKVFSFEQFLSLATLSPVQCSHFWLINNGKKEELHDRGRIEIIDKHVVPKTNTRFWEYLFVYDTIKDSFDKIIIKWFEEKDLYPIREHLIDSISHKGYFEANDFLIVCQAVEGFYCRFAKEDKLNKILKNLIEEFHDIQIQEVTETDIPFIIDTRNHFSHLLPPGKKQHVIYGEELYDLNHKLRKLLICCILKLIGFSNEEINNIFSHSHNSYLRMVSEKSRKLVEEKCRNLDAEIISTTKISQYKPE